MGAGGSIEACPEQLDHDALQALLGDKFDEDIYSSLKDEHGIVTKAQLVEVQTKRNIEVSSTVVTIDHGRDTKDEEVLHKALEHETLDELYDGIDSDDFPTFSGLKDKVVMDLSADLGLVIESDCVISDVVANEQGDLLGLEKGYRITKVNRVEVKSAKDLKKALHTCKHNGDDFVDLFYEVPTMSTATKRDSTNSKEEGEVLSSIDREHRYSTQGIIVVKEGLSPTTQDNVEAFIRKKKEIEMAEEESEKSRLKLEADPTVGKVTINIKEPLGMVIGEHGDITELNRGGQAHTAGLKVGMKIHRIHNKDVFSLGDIKFAMSKFKYFSLKEVDLYYSPVSKPSFISRIGASMFRGAGHKEEDAKDGSTVPVMGSGTSTHNSI